MLILSLAYLLISNALIIRKDKCKLLSRIVIVSLALFGIKTVKNLFMLGQEKAIGIMGGRYHVTIITQSFNVLIFIISAILGILIYLHARIVIVLNLAGYNDINLLTVIWLRFILITNEWFNIANIITLIFIKTPWRKTFY